MPMTLEEFVATRGAWDAKAFAEVKACLGDSAPAIEDSICYDGTMLIHVQDGKFHVHAWWYWPQAYDTLEDAEKNLYQWYLEFAN